MAGRAGLRVRAARLLVSGALTILLVAGAGSGRRAWACGGGEPGPLAVFPGPGASDVSPQSSIVVVTGPGGLLATSLTLEAGGAPVAVPIPTVLGDGLAAGRPARFLRFAGPLLPGTPYVLRALEPGAAAPREVTRFTTAATYSKTVGTPATIERMRLWRVRYPVTRILAGDCVRDEYMGYIDIQYRDGEVPETPPAEVIGTFTLTPRNGASSQSFTFSGERFTGQLSGLPVADLPQPSDAAWVVELAPDREYCLTLTTVGRNDLANLPLRSNTVCAPVLSIDLSGAGGSTDAGADGASAGASDAIVPSATDAEVLAGGSPPVKEKPRGCSVGPGQGQAQSEVGGGTLFLVLLTGLLLRPGSLRRRPP